MQLEGKDPTGHWIYALGGTHTMPETLPRGGGEGGVDPYQSREFFCGATSFASLFCLLMLHPKCEGRRFEIESVPPLETGKMWSAEPDIGSGHLRLESIGCWHSQHTCEPLRTALRRSRNAREELCFAIVCLLLRQCCTTFRVTRVTSEAKIFI